MTRLQGLYAEHDQDKGVAGFHTFQDTLAGPAARAPQTSGR